MCPGASGRQGPRSELQLEVGRLNSNLEEISPGEERRGNAARERGANKGLDAHAAAAGGAEAALRAAGSRASPGWRPSCPVPTGAASRTGMRSTRPRLAPSRPVLQRSPS